MHNAGPNGGAKIQVYPDAYLAAAVDGEAPRVLQTHPTESAQEAGVVGVEAIRYKGAFPVSRLDANVSSSADVSTTLYAMSAFKAGDMAASARPAAAFTLVVRNAGAVPRNVSLLMTMPFMHEVDQMRRGTPLQQQQQQPAAASQDAAACCSSCSAVAACASWASVPGVLR